jgi:hypothetical protein
MAVPRGYFERGGLDQATLRAEVEALRAEVERLKQHITEIEQLHHEHLEEVEAARGVLITDEQIANLEQVNGTQEVSDE